MMKRAFAYLLLPVLAFTSCIRDEIAECPPMQITVAVKDKNYFNIDDVAAKGLIEKKDENLPFREYVSTLYYIVHDEAGNTVAEQHTYEVTGDAKEEVINLPSDLPYGKYRVTVWGNMKSDRPLGDNPADAELESSDAANNDVYLADTEVDFRLGSEHHTVELERTKGRLIIKAEGLPDYISFSEKTVFDVYSVITSGFDYSRLTDLYSQTRWTQKNEMTTHTLTCPSQQFEKSTLDVAFHDESVARDGGFRSLYPEEIKITMGRNELTVVKYIFVEEGGEEPDPDNPDNPDPTPDPDPDPDNPDKPDPEPEPEPDPDPSPDPEPEGKFYIYVLVNDNWEMDHSMEID